MPAMNFRLILSTIVVTEKAVVTWDSPGLNQVRKTLGDRQRSERCRMGIMAWSGLTKSSLWMYIPLLLVLISSLFYTAPEWSFWNRSGTFSWLLKSLWWIPIFLQVLSGDLHPPSPCLASVVSAPISSYSPPCSCSSVPVVSWFVCD